MLDTNDTCDAALRDTGRGRHVGTELASRRVIERQVHLEALARLDREADHGEPLREAEIGRLQTAHADLKKRALEVGAALKDAVARNAAAAEATSQLRAMHVGSLLESADPMIAMFTASMVAERDATVELGAGADFGAVNARVAAINDAIEEAQALRMRPDQSGVQERLAALRAGIPAADQQDANARSRSTKSRAHGESCATSN